MNEQKIKILSRLQINERYLDQDIWIEFIDVDTKKSYRYPHDALIEQFNEHAPRIFSESSWKDYGWNNWKHIPDYKYPFVQPFLSKYRSPSVG